MFKSLKIFLVVLFIGFQTVAQNKENRWVVGASVGVAKFASEDVKAVGDQFIFQVPSLNVSRYFFNGLTLDAGLSFSVIDRIPGFYSNSVSYVSIDGAVKYDFGTLNDNLVPYVILGGSLLKTTYKMTTTTNIGAGGTFWLNPNYGINTQLQYKYSPETDESMRSHTYFSVGVVYSLQPRILVPRLWSNN
ncbi:hypothetical protein KCTC32516_00918 [Polaribacter huanghezhanensis]|uniref:hypothetical protein n=1 Tax=Polaribacter huanghezhanensis TaxID=1354726 RepID=UPI0026489605|nr:hypothetical protein [Polaribacter huanghezhanensis]WKD85577.1 hypothetical protein KCTC32516_00918 [Polaribacter huanghezhanensis]